MWQGVDSRTVPVRHGRESETIRRRLGSTSRSTWAPRTRGATPTASKRGAGRRTIRPRIQQQDSADGPQEVQHVRGGTAGGSTRSAVSRAWPCTPQFRGAAANPHPFVGGAKGQAGEQPVREHKPRPLLASCTIGIHDLNEGRRDRQERLTLTGSVAERDGGCDHKAMLLRHRRPAGVPQHEPGEQ